MANANDVRRAHEILDDLSIGNQPNEGNLNHLRSFLPDLPKQKTVEELTEHVFNAWTTSCENEWGGDGYGSEITLEHWLEELHKQLKELKDTPATAPAMPAGMRIADHEEYGRVVVSPGLNDFGLYLIFVLDSDYKEGAHWHCEHGRTLTFLDAEPAKSAHPEFLETEADYASAPRGTVAAKDCWLAWLKETDGVWSCGGGSDSESDLAQSGKRRVLRWGWGG